MERVADRVDSRRQISGLKANQLPRADLPIECDLRRFVLFAEAKDYAPGRNGAALLYRHTFFRELLFCYDSR